VPLVIGAKKGFPNFNEFTAETAMQVVRRLEFRRRFQAVCPVTLPREPNNQIYSTVVSNLFGVEL